MARVPSELLWRWFQGIVFVWIGASGSVVRRRQLAIDLGEVASQEDSVASHAVFNRDTFMGDRRPLGIELEECFRGEIQSDSFVWDLGAILARDVPKSGPR